MMEENPEKKNEEDNAEQPATDNNRDMSAGSANLLVYLPPLIVLVIAVAGGIYLGRGIEQNRQQLTRISESTSQQQARLDRRLSTLDQNVTRILSEQESQHRALARLREQQPQTTEDWALSEVEYLLIIATHRLLLEQDVTTALSAMELAAARLQSLDSPDLIPVREQLTTDINRLRAVNRVDIPGMALYLGDLIERADTLPLERPDPLQESNDSENNDTAAIPQDTGGWQHYLAVAWQELKSLVVIKRSGEVRQALLLPEEEYFLTQNLRLELENARMAVLRQDTANLQTSVSLLVNWLQRYYDTSDAAVSNVIETLQQMRRVELQPQLPDISSSLETLRAYMRQQ